MAFIPFTIDLMSCEAFTSPFELLFTLLNAFGQMMQEQLDDLDCD
jgi:hypothetical protein